MGIEWFRDLSITIMGFITVVMLIFIGIIIYAMYRKITAVLFQTKTLINSANDVVKTVEETVKSANDVVKTVEETVKSASHSVNDTIAGVKDSVAEVSKGIGNTFNRLQERATPLLPIVALIQGISEGVKSIKSIFVKKTNEGEIYHE